MKNKILISTFILMGFGFMLICSCKKKEESKTDVVYRLPQVTTVSVSVTSNTEANVNGRIDWDGGTTLTAFGICWSATIGEPTIDLSTKTIDGGGSADAYSYPGNFTGKMTGLSLYSTYNVRAYATNSEGTTYGHVLKFTVLTIGTSYQGGTVAYIFNLADHGLAYYDGTHGIIAAANDQSTAIQWYNGTYSFIAALDNSLGTGSANTNTIVSSQGSGSYAAQLCADLTEGGYDDWFLPNLTEMSKLYFNKDAIGNFSNADYWSSMQTSDTTAWSQNFGNGDSLRSMKDLTFHVRAIRTF